MSDWGSTAVEGSVGAVVVCFLLSWLTWKKVPVVTLSDTGI